MVPERLRGKDNGSNMFLAVSYLRSFTVIFATADLLRIRARAEAIDLNILSQASLARAMRIHSVGGWQRMIDDACFFPHRPANPALSRLPCPTTAPSPRVDLPVRMAALGGNTRQSELCEQLGADCVHGRVAKLSASVLSGGKHLSHHCNLRFPYKPHVPQTSHIPK